MCGIVAYLGKKTAQPILVEGLKRLEYRGYDLAGVALLDNGSIRIKKNQGRIISPFAPDREEEFFQGADRYNRKSFTRETDSPRVVIGTASGRAELKK